MLVSFTYKIGNIDSHGSSLKYAKLFVQLMSNEGIGHAQRCMVQFWLFHGSLDGIKGMVILIASTF